MVLMVKVNILDEILTEYDNKISIDLNVDPLGLLVIWSSFGQDIFNRRISSISNDVRNFTLNLFNHSVVKYLVENDSVVLGKGLRNNPAYRKKGKDSTEFKQACLIYLENVFTYSMIENQNFENVDTTGVIGISKSRSRWLSENKNPKLFFSHTDKGHVLVRQNSLGVSGRYKTPMVEMKFFDSTYDYSLPESDSQWKVVQQLVNDNSKPLAKLHKLARDHLTKLISKEQDLPNYVLTELDTKLKKSFVQAFSSSQLVGKYTRDFWLEVTKLNQGAPGALFNVLNQNIQSKKKLTIKEIFTKATYESLLPIEENNKLLNVCRLEPFLAELDLFFDVMLSTKIQSLEDAKIKLLTLGRNAETLNSKAKSIAENTSMRCKVSGTASLRLNELLEIACDKTIESQMTKLLKYHEKVMLARDQSPWVRLSNDNHLNVDVKISKLPKIKDRPAGSWIHSYYIPQFSNFIAGLQA